MSTFNNTSEVPEGTHGPHSTRTANAVDPRVDSDRDGRAAGTHGTGLTGSTNTAGPHSSNLANKMDPRVDSDRDGRGPAGGLTGGTHGTHGTHGSHGTGLTGTTGTHGTTTAGPHDSDLLNKMDPRVDSDRDGSGSARGLTGGTHGTHGTGLTGTTGTHGTTTGTTTAGPHPTDTANKLDPRVDSDRDTTGPHSSNLLNKLDPRVDSDRSGAHNTGLAGGTTGTHGTSGTTTAGPHSSDTANKLDPRVDSDRSSAETNLTGATNTTHNTAGGHHAGAVTDRVTGPASTTAGPHSSNFLNKADPRVDSNLDGSKTILGDKTLSNPQA